MNTKLPLSQPVIAQWAHEYSGHGDMDEDDVWAQPGELSLTKAHLAIATAKCLICQEQKPVLILQ